MKFFVVLSLATICSVIAFTEDDKRNDTKFSQDCANELKISLDDLDNYNQEIENFAYDTKAQNLIKCIYQKFNFIDQNGEFQENVAIKTLSTGEYVVVTEEQLKQCTKTAGDNKANEFALKLLVCFKEADRGSN